MGRSKPPQQNPRHNWRGFCFSVVLVLFSRCFSVVFALFLRCFHVVLALF